MAERSGMAARSGTAERSGIAVALRDGRRHRPFDQRAVSAERAVGNDRALRAEAGDAGPADGAAAPSRRPAPSREAIGVTVALAWHGHRLRREARTRQRQAGGVVVIGHDVPPAGIEDPFSDVQPAAGREGQRHLPVAVAALARIPLHRPHGVGAGGGQPLGDDVAKRGPGPEESPARRTEPDCAWSAM